MKLFLFFVFGALVAQAKEPSLSKINPIKKLPPKQDVVIGKKLTDEHRQPWDSRKLSKDGGMDLGGGGTSNKDSISFEIFEAQLSTYFETREALFHFFHNSGLVSQRVLGIEKDLSNPLPPKERANLLFGREMFEKYLQQEEKIQALIRDLHLEVRKEEPCYDRIGQVVDASIYTQKPQGVCFSFSRLSPKLNQENYKIELLALLAHEILHHLGGVEAEAQQLQSVILGLGPNFDAYLAFADKTRVSEKQILADLQELPTYQLEARSSEQLCKDLAKFHHTLRENFITWNIQSAFFASWPEKKLIAYHAALVVSGYALDYCTDDDDFLKSYRQKKFNGKTESSISQLYPDPLVEISPRNRDEVLQYTQYLLADLSPASIIWTRKGDAHALKKNIETLKAIWRPYFSLDQ